VIPRAVLLREIPAAMLFREMSSPNKSRVAPRIIQNPPAIATEENASPHLNNGSIAHFEPSPNAFATIRSLVPPTNRIGS
jgi:hypothetical protein